MYIIRQVLPFEEETSNVSIVGNHFQITRCYFCKFIMNIALLFVSFISHVTVAVMWPAHASCFAGATWQSRKQLENIRTNPSVFEIFHRRVNTVNYLENIIINFVMVTYRLRHHYMMMY